MAGEMTLLWASGSPPCMRVMIALEEKNLRGYKNKRLYFEKNEHRSQQVLDTNPRGQVPTFKCGNKILNESCAACMYLENKFKEPKLTPDDDDNLALMYQRMFESVNLTQKSGEVLFYEWKVPEAERHASALKRYKENLTAEVKLWEGYMQKAKGGFLAGSTFSLADVIVYPTIGYLFYNGLCEEKYPNLAKYYNSLKTRPSIEATWPPTWKESPRGGDALKDI